MVEKLMERKDINVNLQNKFGNTPLIVSCYSNNKHITKKIINSKNIDTNIINSNGDTALIIACGSRRSHDSDQEKQAIAQQSNVEIIKKY